MERFTEIYAKLNEAQKKAVDTIDGPVLVLAGPGTGKTQLLSARVANILQKTDTLPSSILCLTFTDAAAINMRERLVGMIGDDAYDVHISTYHSFASDIITAYPDFFQSIDLETGEDSRMERPVNELGQLEIVKEIVDKLPYDDPLRSSRHYLKSLLSTISDIKQANITSAQLAAIATDNADASARLSADIHECMSAHKSIPRKSTVAIELFETIKNILARDKSDIAVLARKELDRSLEEAQENGSTKPLTIWKNDWLHKDENDQWTFTDPSVSNRMLSLARIYDRYQQALRSSGQYDFNDMILQTLQALEKNSELRFNLQERYQYLLLDEFQDTNAAQFALVHTLADHPVHEGRPNIMAVGDDDQGIFAFQGADVGNMVEFIHAFRDVHVINLVQNYRSHPDVLHVAHNIAEQIQYRLQHSLEGVSKEIIAASAALPKSASIQRVELNSLAAENGWIGETVAHYIEQGTRPEEIAIIAPKHVILEALVPFLNAHGVPVAYEKRENIFETPIVQGILLLCRFLQSASKQHYALMDELLPQVLSLEYWQIPTETIWNLNWEHARLKIDDEKRWSERALDIPELKQSVLFLLRLSSIAEEVGLEATLDYITGAKPLIDGQSGYTSPFKKYYFSADKLSHSSLQFYEAISHLSVIREQLRAQQVRKEDRLTIDALLTLYDAYQEAEQPLINTHPIAQADSAVQLSTVYKAKGLEYEYVFLPSMDDSVWGSKASGSSNKIKLPANLAYIRHGSGGEDTLRRLLFVAITRAKHGLIMTSHASTESGKSTVPVKYLQEYEDGETKIVSVLPDEHAHIQQVTRQATKLQQDVNILWHSRHTELTPSLQSLLKDRLKHYVMSPTHLNTFTNIEYAGPYAFLLGTLLRFPEAPTPDSIYGDALHRALEHFQKSTGNTSDIPGAIKIFESRLARSYLVDTDKEEYTVRGRKALKTYLQKCGKKLRQPAGVEVDFRREGCAYKGAVLTGKIDRLEVDHAKKTVRIIDFKSGQPSTKWGSASKYINYKQQLYFYILLIETSRSYRGYSVQSAALEFIEPTKNGECAEPLEVKFDAKEYEQFKKLLLAVWQHIQQVNLPDISSYPATPAGVRQFESMLVEQMET